MDITVTPIITLILDEAERVDNPDRVSRIYNIFMKVQAGIIEVMDQIREEERKK